MSEGTEKVNDLLRHRAFQLMTEYSEIQALPVGQRAKPLQQWKRKQKAFENTLTMKRVAN